ARWTRLGNANGTMLLLRLVEFVRRIAKDLQNAATHTVIQDIRNSLNRLLAKEAWWRWARASLQILMPLNSCDPGYLFTLWDI
ncbi:hypothetical protein M422DRAFT_25845, partial [Sphaerobolus stellatus SS14]